MKRLIYILLITGLLFANAYLIIRKACELQGANPENTGRLHIPVQQINSRLNPHTTIGYYTNAATDTMRLFYETQFAMAPYLVENKGSDTMLVIIDKGRPYDGPAAGQLIFEREDSRFIYRLVKHTFKP